MVLAVKIQNRETGEYMTKGGGWNKRGKSWATLGYAKLAVCPVGYYYCGIVKKQLNSDFIIINDDGRIEKMPVALYYLDYFERELERCFSRGRAGELITEIKQYCKDNNIKLEEKI